VSNARAGCFSVGCKAVFFFVFEVEKGDLKTANPNERLIRILQATPEQQALIDKILEGKAAVPLPMAAGPLLLPMGKAADLLGVSRPTLWRMLNAGRLTRVEVLPKTYRVRRSEIEALVNGINSSSPPGSVCAGQEATMRPG
jgi:excisionase family DNA binding protein